MWSPGKDTFAEKLEALGADVICFQETMLKQDEVTGLSDAPDFDAFFSCANWARKGFHGSEVGVHGAAAFTRRSVVVPVKAEAGLKFASALKSAGLSGLVGTYPPALWLRNSEESLESEGRFIVLDLQLFVLINAYLPSEGPPGYVDAEEKRRQKPARKMEIIALFDVRIKALQEAGREVVVIGTLWDSEKRAQAEGLESLMDHPGRAWLAHSTGKNGTLVDVFRDMHPGEPGLYSWYWGEQHRLENRGSRVDHALVTPGLMPWIKDCKILHEGEGSDHLPLGLDLHDKIDGPDGSKLLFNELNGGRLPNDPPPKPPPLAAKYRHVAPPSSPPTSPPEIARRLSASLSGRQSAVSHAQAPTGPSSLSASTKTAEDASAPSTSPAHSSPNKSISPSATSKKRPQLETVDLTQDDSDDEIQIITPRPKRNCQSPKNRKSKASPQKSSTSEKRRKMS